MDGINKVPALVVFGVAAFAGVWFLTWHRFANDDADTEWLDPGQPPAQVALPTVPGVHGSGSPMSCNDAFRGRCYPDVLASLSLAVQGD